jgi:hypothetical protein
MKRLAILVGMVPLALTLAAPAPALEESVAATGTMQTTQGFTTYQYGPPP